MGSRGLLRVVIIGGPLTIWEKGSLGWKAVQVFWFLLGSRYGRRPNPTPDSNPNPDPKPHPKRAKPLHKRGCAAFASNQEFFQLRTTIPKCRQRYAHFKLKRSLKIPSPRLLNLLYNSQLLFVMKEALDLSGARHKNIAYCLLSLETAARQGPSLGTGEQSFSVGRLERLELNQE